MAECKRSNVKEKPANLHRLLDNITEAHRRDVELYTSGYLNSSKLNPLPTKKSSDNLKWGSSTKKVSERLQSTGYKKPSSKRQNLMSNALLDFSLGSSGIIPMLKSDRSISTSLISTFNPLIPTVEDDKVEDQLISDMENLMVAHDYTFPFEKSEQRTTPTHFPTPASLIKKTLPPIIQPNISRIYIEELKLPEIMLSRLNLLNVPPSLQPLPENEKPNFEKKKFITTHLAGITRKDQFQKMMDFDETVLCKPELLEKNVRDGHKAVQHLENKLVNRLLQLQTKNPPPGPSFERLQLFSEIWCDLILDSSMFGTLLKRIKEEYDNYLTHLLDSMKSSNRGELSQCLHIMQDLLNEQRVVTADNLHEEISDLVTLCREALFRNHHLHQSIAAEKHRIEEERRLQQEEDEENIRRMLPVRRRGVNKAAIEITDPSTSQKGKKITIEKQLRNLKIDIWKRIDTLGELRKQLKYDYVPKPLHRNILHAIKDTELEMQKLQQQTAFLLQHKQELRDQLYACFTARNVSEDYQTRISELIEVDIAPSQ